MSEPMRLFDLLGVSSPTPGASAAAAAAARWRVPGHDWPRPGVEGALPALMSYLQTVMRFENVRPGADADRVGLYAEIKIVDAEIGQQPLFVPQMPNIKFFLRDTRGAPARLFVTQRAAGTEWVVEGLPVEIRLPAGLLEPLPPPAREGDTGPGGVARERTPEDRTYPDEHYRPDPSDYDDLKIVLRYQRESSVFVHVRARMTEGGDFVIESAVPISVGPCRLFGVFPCYGVHDLALVPSPQLAGIEHDEYEQAFEWTRHELNRLPPNVPVGLLTFRTADIDISYEPLRSLVRSINGQHPERKIEFVLEDVAVTLYSTFAALPPLPVHGRFGLRRDRGGTTDPASLEEYDLSGEPLKIIVGSWQLWIQQFFLQTPAPPDFQPFNIQLALVKGDERHPDLVRERGHRIDEAGPHGPAFTFAVGDEWTLQFGIRDPGTARREEHATNPSDPTTNPPSKPRHELSADPHGGPDRDTTVTTRTDHGAVRWTVPGMELFRIPAANIAVSIMGFKLGASMLRLAGVSSRQYTWPQCFQLLVDLGVFQTRSETTTTSRSTRETGIFEMRTMTGRPLSVVLRDIGWDLGRLSLQGLSFPEGVQLTSFRVLRLFVEEMGWVAETNGGYYFAFSGGIGFDFSGSGGGASRPPSSTSSGAESGGGTHAEPGGGSGAESGARRSSGGTRFGITFRRLRVRVGGNESAPPFLLDGVAMDVRFNNFSLRGFGMYDRRLLRPGDPHEEARLDEYGFGIEIRFRAAGKDFIIGTQFVYGSIDYTDPARPGFSYWLFGAQFSPIPLGPYQLVNIRLLVGGNLDPNLEEADAQTPNMRLLGWYNDHEEALTIPESRDFGNIWHRRDRSFSIGVGAGLTLPVGRTIRLDLFLFFHTSPEESGLLILLRVYLLAGDDPVGYGALELDFRNSRWGFLVGVDLNLATILNIRSRLLRFIRLTGTLYAGNQPGTFAIGHLNDQDSWLSLSLTFGTPMVGLRVLVGICIELIEGGPNGFGFIVLLRGYVNLVVAQLGGYFTLSLLAGNWRSESKACGFRIDVEAGLSIRLLWIFNFAISGRIEYEMLSSSVAYRRLVAEFRVETPWWLPSVSFRFERVWEEPRLEQMTNISPPLIGADAVREGEARQTQLQVTPLRNEDVEYPPVGEAGAAPTPTAGARKVIREREVYNMATLRSLGEPSYEAYRDEPEVEPVGVDSTIALNFKPALDDRLASGENTPEGASRQPSDGHQNDLELTYELISHAIRRRPRFVEGTAWADLLSARETRITDPANPDVPSGEARYTSSVKYEWDRDMLSDGRLDPRRLKINAETPYSFLTANPEADEAHARNEPGWPCAARTVEGEARWHVLDFRAATHGARAPRVQRFSESRSTLRWNLSRPPVVALSETLAGARPVARVRRAGIVTRASAAARRDDEPVKETVVATLDFDQPVMFLELEVGWRADRVDFRSFISAQTQHHVDYGLLIIESYRGVERVGLTRVPLYEPAPAPITINAWPAMTRVVIRYTHEPPEQSEQISAGTIEIAALRYRAVREMIETGVRAARAEERQRRALAGEGKLAWLPNHEYEVSAEVKVTLRHRRVPNAAVVSVVRQKTRFLTKGLLGLNASARCGDELEPHVESFYPRPAPRTLYRSEPVALAFKPSYQILLPLDRAPSPDDPAERSQVLEWVLTVAKVSGSAGQVRVSQTSPDWVTSHRVEPLLPRFDATGVPLGLSGARVIDDSVVRRAWRTAPHLDPMQRRLQRVLANPEGCGDSAPRRARSRVLLHQPSDPEAATARPFWSPDSTFEVCLRQQGGPFIERPRFEASDMTAFTFAAEAGHAPSAWQVSDSGEARVSRAAAWARSYAIFGESSWDHIHLRAGVKPARGGVAGLAVGVSGEPIDGALIVVLTDDAEQPPRLQVFEASRGVVRELTLAGGDAGGKRLPARADAYTLEVIAFDDRLRASVGEVSVEVPRGRVRQGRAALVASGESAVVGLHVEPLAAYSFQFRSSRYERFEDHVGSFGGESSDIPASGEEAATLLTPAFVSEATGLMRPDAAAEERQLLFDRCVQYLSLPLRLDVNRLEVSRLVRSGAAELLLLESPEPFPLSEDVSLNITRLVGANRESVRTLTLTNGDETRALVFPLDASGAALAPLGGGLFHLTFTLSRERFRGEGIDSTYRAAATLTLDLRSPSTFVHRAAAGNVSGHVSSFDVAESGSDPAAVVLATPCWTDGGEYNNHPFGVYYTGYGWAVFNQDFAALPDGAAFNVSVERGFTHRATVENSVYWATTLDHPQVNGNPDAVLVATPHWNPVGAGGVYHPHPVGVRYEGGRWAIVNQDFALMADASREPSFNVIVCRDGFVHVATASSLAGEADAPEFYTVIDHPLLNDNPRAAPFVTQNWNPRGLGSVNNNHHLGVRYLDGRWVIFNQDRQRIPAGAAFNVCVFDLP